MEFFDKIGKKATEAYKVTADKTGKIARETKLKLKISEFKSQINNLYSEIGKKAYEKHSEEAKGSENADKISKEIKDMCIEIDKIQDEIDDLEKECLDLNDKKKCDKCGNEIEKGVKYCPHCGAEQKMDEEPENTETSEGQETSSEALNSSDNKKESSKKSTSSKNKEKTSEESSNKSEAKEVEVLPKEDKK